MRGEACGHIGANFNGDKTTRKVDDIYMRDYKMNKNCRYIL